MTKSKLQPALHFDGQAQMRRSKKYAQELAKRMPDLSDSLNDLLESLALQHAQQSKEAKLKPLHGAPHAHQWLDCGDTLGLVDFDRTCLGEPELDATTFIAEMDFEDRQTVPVDELNHAFLEAYQQTAGKLDTDLLKAYRSHKRLAKALKAARFLRVNGDTKARKHLNFAHRALV
jgi:thiamine kinase-like enzyme